MRLLDPCRRDLLAAADSLVVSAPALGALALAALAAVAGDARADTAASAGGVELDWIAPGECADRGRVLAEIEQRLGRSSEANGEPPLKARAVVSRNGRGSWDLRLSTTLGETTRSRELHGETCAELADAAALIIALAIDPDAASRGTPTAEPNTGAAPGDISGADPGADGDPGAGASAAADASPDAPTAAEAPPAASPSPGASAAPAQGPSRPLELRGTLRASGVLDTASLPAVAPGAGIAAGMLIGAVRVELSGTYFGAQQAFVERTTMGGDVQLTTGGLRVCYAMRYRSIELGPCAGVEVGVMSADSFGAASPGSNRALWVAPHPGALATFTLSDRLRVPLTIDVPFPVTRDRFVLVGIGAVHRSAAATLRASLGVEVRFP
ncbi:hypothetical protein WME97_41515 [Sorangium sp. So ce367]|uniref:hypothetical protein n=1 Tax=Sorangium sp. So ce367 TaxID=3133305 RepID=UPI003F5FF935